MICNVIQRVLQIFYQYMTTQITNHSFDDVLYPENDLQAEHLLKRSNPPPFNVCLDLTVSSTPPVHALISQLSRLSQLVYDPLATFRPLGDDHHHRSTSPSHVWARQRQDDTVFLLPEAFAGKEIDLAAVMNDPDVGSADSGVIMMIPPGEGGEEEEEGNMGGLVSVEQVNKV